MPYTALYRKFRPHTFDAVIGQEHIVRTLKNQLSSARISHAYLFCGTRGTGKTSTAKIFARAINCEGDPSNADCDCRSCRAINSGYSLNVIEIDAASNNSVDNVRDIREEVKYPPADGRYKVYIIDEVHMLSAGAFNALLKTLEEPPEYVIFILATTDPQKVPATVHSRCQRFDFRRISADDIAKTLRAYMDADGREGVADDALAYIARISDGSMRDALSVLDQCMTFFFDSPVTLEGVLDIVGAVDDGVFYKLADALQAMDGVAVMEIIDELTAYGRDINRFASDFVIHLRNLLVALSVDGAGAALDLSAETVLRLKAQAENLGRDTLLKYINVFSALLGQLRYATNERVVFEVCCLRLCSPEDTVIADDAQATDARLRKLEDGLYKLKSGAIAVNTAAAANTAAAVKPAAEPPEAPKPPKSVPEDIRGVCAAWAEFAATVKRKPLNAYLKTVTPAYLEGGALMLVSKTGSAADVVKKYDSDIKSALTERFGREFDVCFIGKAEYDEQHRKRYGVVDESVGISRESFTDKVDMDIIIED